MKIPLFHRNWQLYLLSLQCCACQSWHRSVRIQFLLTKIHLFLFICPGQENLKEPDRCKTFCIQMNPSRKLCQVHCLNLYLIRTNLLRIEENSKSLFIGLIRPHAPASGTTLGHWIKSYLQSQEWTPFFQLIPPAERKHLKQRLMEFPSIPF